MEGVQILNQFEVVTRTVFSWQSFWIGALIGALVTAITLTILLASDSNTHWEFREIVILFAITLLIFALFIGGLGGVLCADPVEYETRYEVTIDPEVSMTDFMEKYEILETRGAIYTVKEK